MARLRRLTVSLVGGAWTGLGSWNEADQDRFLELVVPAVLSSQRASVAVTEAYLAQALGRQPLGVSVDELVGSAVRAGAAPEEVYRRPFVTVWTALKNGSEWRDAVGAGGARAQSTAALDVQLSMRATANAVQEADDAIFGYQRVADPGACAFCQEVDGAYLKSADASPLHNNCGCGLEPLTEPHPRARFLPSGDEVVRDGFAIHSHGELGAVLADPAHDFTTAAQALS
jgi:hypothetical protein